MFIATELFKKIILWGDGAMVKDLTFQYGGEFNLHTYSPKYFGYLNDIIK
jgi:hypothetical protein